MGVLGVGRVAALARGATTLAPPPPRRARRGGASAVGASSLTNCRGLSRLAPARGAVKLSLSQQLSLAAGQQTELLQRNKEQQRKKEEERRRKNSALEVFQAVEAALRCTCQKKVNI